MKTAKATRVVKLQGKYRAVAGDWQGGKEVPWLSINGVWLEAAGFKAGHQVEITVANNELVIKNLSANGDC